MWFAALALALSSAGAQPPPQGDALFQRVIFVCPTSEYIVRFDPSGAGLTPDAADMLDAAVARAGACELAQIVVTPIGANVPAELSQRRSLDVADGLYFRGVPRNRIIADFDADASDKGEGVRVTLTFR